MLTYFLYKKIANQSNKYVIIVLHNSNYCYFTFQPEFQLGLQCTLTIRYRGAFKTTLLKRLLFRNIRQVEPPGRNHAASHSFSVECCQSAPYFPL